MTNQFTLASLLVIAAFGVAEVEAGQLPGGEKGAIPVTVVQREGGYRLLRGGEPYVVRGAGLEFGSMDSLAANGGNSFRTWRTDNGQNSGQEILDRAAELGLTVALCIEIGRERHGFDYDDEEAVAAQLAYARGEVMKYKDHPALLAWIIGNEPNLFFENPNVFDAIDDIAQMIHEVDGQHPATTALAGFNAELAELIRTRSPSLDFVSIQMYGDIVNLPQYLEEARWDRPYMVTEWGATGHWEVAKTSWDAPVEQHSSDKADSYLRAYRSAIAVDPARVLGSYVFLWGQKQERTPTWYGMFLADGAETEVIDVMHYIWNDAWPANRAPRVRAMQLDGRSAGEEITLGPGTTVGAEFAVDDPEGGALRFRWAVMRESGATQTGGDREEIPETLEGLVTPGEAGQIRLATPVEPGAYRLFAYAYDEGGKAAHANVPFLVRQK